MDWRTGWVRDVAVFAGVWVDLRVMISILALPGRSRRRCAGVRPLGCGFLGRAQAAGEKGALSRGTRATHSALLRASMARTHPFAEDDAWPKPHASEGVTRTRRTGSPRVGK